MVTQSLKHGIYTVIAGNSVYPDARLQWARIGIGTVPIAQACQGTTDF